MKFSSTRITPISEGEQPYQIGWVGSFRVALQNNGW